MPITLFIGLFQKVFSSIIYLQKCKKWCVKNGRPASTSRALDGLRFVLSDPEDHYCARPWSPVQSHPPVLQSLIFELFLLTAFLLLQHQRLQSNTTVLQMRLLDTRKKLLEEDDLVLFPDDLP
jgi:hypothetical protein